MDFSKKIHPLTLSRSFLSCRTCVEECQKIGCIGDSCFQQCISSSDSVTVESPWYMQEPLYLSWKELECMGNCRYNCMVKREKEREMLGYGAVKYHGKWPFKRVFGLQEPVSVALSALNLALQFHGWVSFVIFLNCKLPLRPKDGRTYYEFAGFWEIYRLLSMNAWLWSVLFHSRLIAAILRTFNVRDEASRVMVAAPLLAFVTTHILYLNLYKLDYATIFVSFPIDRQHLYVLRSGFEHEGVRSHGLTQLLLWAVWAGLTRHPSRLKVWAVTLGCGLAMLLEVYDFPPHSGYVDAHAVWHAIAIPLTYMWWSFIKDDAEFVTLSLLAKQREKGDHKKVK